ncbi:MAG: MazG nucleotide pyrophosphohydrolase domain-containing protein [Acidimicrobiales bacterium]|jgi:NTP pyrophosphatase (non-canonical NTP hydrolase)|nr:pyrophosphohydrolase [Acidimicrobiaceae bacterium]MDG2351959.1 MazG nucleotide pyrophosphohydrolase domain-containing protein [Acidimicrobiales bacterium]MDP6161294.1 MazG nucleotide pyrophosphohydrolase domain-containing protein [Acidimicrobiales bacterium]MDP6286170.1 MazG nucleotide pyrophosphohydrolase domain-containing protein [Acidimicrobiales bacterium]HJO40262.1 MazG nucleotide pyrophosphohydrolase domain-containing protein [Acidimicrobiales bacterium]|tara:strand:- start:10065 stop:10316 length:252 start_codon:yes stop_codon:yes gene_type:complete
MELNELQDLMENLYGQEDRSRGLPSTVAWLCEEVGELAQAVRKGSREDQLHELADVLAWLASLSNQLDLSLDMAMQRYVENPP